MFSALFGFSGRLNRAPFWGYGILLIVVAGIIQSAVMGTLLGPTLAELGEQFAQDKSPSVNDIVAMFSGIAPRLGWTVLVLQAVFSIPTAALCVKRRHDRNSSGLDVWIYLGLSLLVTLLMLLGIGLSATEIEGVTLPIPDSWLQLVQLLLVIYGIYLFVVLCFLKGTVGPNSYGPDPLQG